MREQPFTTNAGAGRAWAGLAATLVVLSTLPLTQAQADQSLAHQVPADVGLFVELRRGGDLLLPLSEPQIWLTLAELAGQPAELEETAEWRQRVKQTVNMTPEEAVRRLLSRRVAFVSEALRRSQDAVVLCRPAIPPRALLQGWQAQPLPTAGRASVYRLPNSVGLGIHGDLLVFGDNTAHGMFPRVLHLFDADRPQSLADNDDYQRLLARVPPDPDGVFFARLGDPQATSAPAASRPARLELPGPLRGSANILLALHRDGRFLHFSAVGDAADNAPEKQRTLSKLVADLPERTLLAWAGHVDDVTLAQAVYTLPHRNRLRIVFQAAQRTGAIDRLAGALDSAVCLAAGVVTPASRAETAPPVPALALLLTTRDGEAAAAEWRALLDSMLSLYKLLTLKSTTAFRPLEFETVTVAGATVEQLDISALMDMNPEQTALGEVHLCWTLDDDVLIIASHVDWLRQILAARHGQGAQLASVLDLTNRPATEQRDNIFVAQTGPIADLGTLWLKYFERTAPAVLEQSWWRAYQPGGSNVRLGIQVIAQENERRLRVHSVTPGTSADGILKPGDDIVGCNGRRFATTQPVQEMTRGLLDRADARWIDVYVERDRVIRVRRIPLQFFDPVQLLRRMVSIGGLLQRVIYSDAGPDPAGPRGYLTLELRGEARPLFDFPLTSQPTTTQPE